MTSDGGRGDQFHGERRIDGRLLAGIEIGKPFHLGIETPADSFHC